MKDKMMDQFEERMARKQAAEDEEDRKEAEKSRRAHLALREEAARRVGEISPSTTGRT
jgi:hypothetical protein